MKPNRPRSKRRLTITVGSLVLALAVALPFARVRAQVEPSAEGPTPGATPFTLYPADPDAIRYEDTVPRAQYPTDGTHPEVRESVDAIGEWAETQNGYDVHQAWSAYTNLMVQEAARQKAAREAGIDGLEDMGVR